MMLPCCMPCSPQTKHALRMQPKLGVSQLTAAKLLCVGYLHASWIRFGFQAFDEASVAATDGHNLAGWTYLLCQSLHNLLNCSHTLSATCDAKQPSAKHVDDTEKTGCADSRDAVTLTHLQKSYDRWYTELGRCICCTMHAELLAGHLRGSYTLHEACGFSKANSRQCATKRCCCLSCAGMPA